MKLRLRRRKPLLPEPRARRHREVGICGACGDALVLDKDVLEAACPCGISRIPRSMFLHR